MVKVVTVLSCVFLLAACASTGSGQLGDARRLWCETNEPWDLTEAEIKSASDALLDRVNSHNDQGEAWCGWRPPAPASPVKGAAWPL